MEVFVGSRELRNNVAIRGISWGQKVERIHGMYEEGSYSDTYVKARLTKQKLMIRRLILAACVILLVFAVMAVSGFFRIVALVLAVALDAVMIFFMPKKYVDHEYVFVDGQIDFDRIIAGRTRRTMCRTDMDKVEVVAPEGSHALDAFADLAVRDYSSRSDEERHYMIVAEGKDGMFRIRFTPNEKLLKQMKIKGRDKVIDE